MMPALTWNTAAGDLTIGGVAMNCAAWRVENLLDLWFPADQRGKDQQVAGVAGARAKRRVTTATKRSLRLTIVGDVDRTGATNSDWFEGLAANVAYLRDNVIAPTGTGDGTRSAVLTMPNASTLTEPVHVEGMELGTWRPDGLWCRAVVTLSIPSGRIQ